jgi:N-formylglutamate deformylase
MKKIILHIPHSAIEIPFYDGFVIDQANLQHEMLKLTDWYTDDLYESKEDYSICAKFSRVFCDVERFADDSQEVMANVGMGVLYEKTDDGQQMRHITPELRNKILEHFYRKHHEMLEEATSTLLEEQGEAIIIDCHSFSDIPFQRDLNKDLCRPDINIGTDDFHTNNKLFEISYQFFCEEGFKIGVNWPYSGTIVPMRFYKRNTKVLSIMIEINRKLYLMNGTNKKNKNFSSIKNTISTYIKLVKECI